jgi:uncharacterized protein YbgA (DUF1722 family)
MNSENEALQELQDITEEYERAVLAANQQATRLLGHFAKKLELREVDEMRKRIEKKSL